MILFNPVIISVIVLLVLCLLKLDVLLSLLVAAMVGGLSAGMGIEETVVTLVSGMGGSSETALSYILLGVLAVELDYTGTASLLSRKIGSMIKGNKTALVLILALVACLSQNLIPIHIAFIPIMIPPMLTLMNKLKLDRRAVACSLSFGLQAPYVSIPVGFGLMYHTILANNISKNGLEVYNMEIWKYTWPIGVAMFVGLLIALFIFRKPREYETDEKVLAEYESDKNSNTKLNRTHVLSLIAALSTVVVQVKTGSMPLGALTGVLLMIIFKTVKWKDVEEVVGNGVKMMGYIAFIMLVAEGFGSVLSSSGSINELVEFAVSVSKGSKLLASTAMIITGMFIVTGIGSSFGTVPILSVLYVPICVQMGYSKAATVILIAAAAAIGDAGSPVSDTALGPTAGLNADGQHDHIWDTCVPTFASFNIPIALCGIIMSALVL